MKVVNIHTDFASYRNRTQSVELVVQRIQPWLDNGETVLVAGDYNARLGSPILGLVEDAGLSFPGINGATFHFNRGLNLFAAIDHIAHTKQLQPIRNAVVVQTQFSDEWPTDHYPVVVDFSLTTE